MKSFVTGLAAACLIVGMAAAQTTTPGTTTSGTTATPTMPMTGPATGTTMGTTGAGTTATGTSPMRPMTGTTMGAAGKAPSTISGVAAASGSNNQAVATTSANAPMPAKGKNSFTMNQARTRIQTRGFAQVVNLKKDNNGVWRGKGQRDGASVDVWVDYKGNVGQQ